VRSSVYFFNFQSPLFSLRSSSSCRRLFPRLPVIYILPSVFPSITRFWRQFLPKMWPIQLPFLLFIACRIFLSSQLCVTLLHFSHDRSNWSSPPFSSTTFQNSPCTSDLICEVYWQCISGPGSSVGIATELWAGRSGIESRWGRDFPPVQTGPGAHPASCKRGAGSFPEVKSNRGVLLTTHPLLVPRSWKSRAIPLPTLWATPGL